MKPALSRRTSAVLPERRHSKGVLRSRLRATTTASRSMSRIVRQPLVSSDSSTLVILRSVQSAPKDLTTASTQDAVDETTQAYLLSAAAWGKSLALATR